VATAIEEALDQQTTVAGLDILTVEESDLYQNWLIYGLSGAGKTVLAGSASIVPEMSPVLFVDIEGGIKSLRSFYPQVKVVRVRTFKELQRLAKAIASGSLPYKTLIIDSLSEAQKMSMQLIMAEAYRENPEIDPDIPRMRDWGKNIEQIRRFVRQMRDLPINTIFTALSVEDKDNKNRTTNRVALPGKLSNEIPGFFDQVGFLYIKQKGEDSVRYLLTSQTETTMAKDRSTKLPKTIESPTMQEIFNLINSPATQE
jgi:hypothetical protein